MTHPLDRNKAARAAWERIVRGGSKHKAAGFRQGLAVADPSMGLPTFCERKQPGRKPARLGDE